MKKRYAIAAMVTAIIGLTMAVGAYSLGTNDKQTCPDGQELVSVQAGGLQLHNDKPPPPGMHYSDTSDGVRVNSDRNSASGNVPLRIECR